MTLVTDEKLLHILHELTLNKADRIYEGCKMFHFYFEEKKTSFSYNKNDLIKMKG